MHTHEVSGQPKDEMYLVTDGNGRMTAGHQTHELRPARPPGFCRGRLNCGPRGLRASAGVDHDFSILVTNAEGHRRVGFRGDGRPTPVVHGRKHRRNVARMLLQYENWNAFSTCVQQIRRRCVCNVGHSRLDRRHSN
jgi:hypothetical protein